MNHSAREVENAIREKERTVALHESKRKRAKTMITEATTESADKVLHHPDVIDVVCGPLQTQLRELRKQLAEEKSRHRKTQR